jgi:60 kDa SS-A/Ro ribonucleoprotein
MAHEREDEAQGLPLTGQMRPLDPRQIPNAAGGWVFPINRWDRLLRFLIIGTEGGTYYVDEGRIQTENLLNTAECLRENGPQVVEITARIAEERRAYKATPALWVLALAFRSRDPETRRAAAANFHRIVRNGSELLTFAAIYRQMEGGWGRLKRAAIRNWYALRPPEELAYQVLKYQERARWSHRDLLRMAHPRLGPEDEVRQAIVRWIVRGWEEVPERPPHEALRLIWAFERAKRAESEEEIIELIRMHRLTWEMVPSGFRNSPKVWQALLPEMPALSLVRHLGYMTSLGVFEDRKALKEVLRRLEEIHRAPIHPVRLLLAATVYEMGQGTRRRWEPLPEISRALHQACLRRMEAARPIRQPFLVALDISGSMWHNRSGQGLPAIFAAAAYGLYALQREPEAVVIGFDTQSHRLFPEALGSTVLRLVEGLARIGRGGTDLSLPFRYIEQSGVDVEAIVILTDNETWAGQEHPFAVLRRLRSMRPALRVINVATTATGYSLQEPDDLLSFHIVGFDAGVVSLIEEILSASPVSGEQAAPGP